MKKLLSLIVSVSIFLFATDKLPKSVLKLIPKGYSILNFTRGDLNLDKYDDAILILKQKGENKEELKRPLYILLGNSQGVFQKVAENNNSVLGFFDGGVFGDPFDGVDIKKGYFAINHYGGSNWRWSRVIIFKYNKEKKNWFLYKDLEESYHISNPTKVETEIQTVKDFGVVPFEKYNIFD